MDQGKVMWEKHFKNVHRLTRTYFPWVQEYVPQLKQANMHRILDIGCGTGAQTQFLVESGFDVTGTDYAQTAIELAKQEVSKGHFLQWDTRQPFPFPDEEFDMVLASLSLHYFDPRTLSNIMTEISRLLRQNGLFLFRLNSIHDPHVMAPQTIERYYFSLDDCRQLLCGWTEIELKEHQVEHYSEPKVVCEGLYQKFQP
ncbi:class I SAM-dependent methyltransferase [Alicyclobacillus ferrooxydans]|uniref:Methyltransferase type 11 domain-containing protein n=1 Tax=Alicyclobacillus ferrooxydans TaxID=471514 RepID=A0A0P9CQH1_9BACL|nr:class I SAM-dependent methyltransferase [Alicyclobacillus ferrooxydans]KPV38942.1 hypothetical protein AN477_23150 [Alicyclobacillus ferrooxydans]